jgi:hypothetical protein
MMLLPHLSVKSMLHRLSPCPTTRISALITATKRGVRHDGEASVLAGSEVVIVISFAASPVVIVGNGHTTRMSRSAVQEWLPIETPTALHLSGWILKAIGLGRTLPGVRMPRVPEHTSLNKVPQRQRKHDNKHSQMKRHLDVGQQLSEFG